MVRWQGAKPPTGGLVLILMKLETNVYVDGFNLYYNCVKGTQYRWLNLSKLCTLLLPGHRINRIRYFTSYVIPHPKDPQQLQRQLTYVRALKTIPNLTVHRGQFMVHSVWRPLAQPPAADQDMVQVLDTKEKGSDVNLASYLLVDGFNKEYEMAVVISSDSDLVEPIKLANSHLGLPVGVLHPHRSHSVELSKVAKFYRPIRERALRDSLFPPVLTDAAGTIIKPPTW
ncbi:MAG: NYN domain-containing protein [Dehalococcoidia bacterium]|nr:MAG: NYN domain-containing protein [Dehalococcoidia bacterium]